MFVEMTSATEDELAALEVAYSRWAKKMMRRKLFHGYIVTATGGEVAASGCVWLRDQQPSPQHLSGRIPYLMSVYTSPDFRRSGLASMIVKEAMDWAKRNDYHRLTLHASVKGRKVYSKLGWKRGWEMEYSFD
jgi:GNAT superfamily N-acetyltransferase